MINFAVIIFDKFEELEAIAPIDILRRADIHVTVLALGDSLNVVGRNAIFVKADELFQNANSIFDGIVIAGGPGVQNILDSQELINFVSKHFENDKIIAAICAAPMILKNAGVLAGKACTGHTSIFGNLGNLASPEDVVVSDKIVTSRGAGTAIEFALSLVRLTRGEDMAKTIADSICFSHNF